MGLPESHVSKARQALGCHSQGNIFMTDRFKDDVVTPEMWDKMDQLLNRFGVPIKTGCTMEEYKEYLLRT